MADNDSISATVGNEASDVAVGKNIKQSHQEATGNVVNVNFPTWTPDRPHGQGEGLSAAAEDRLQSGIINLHREVAALSGTIVALTGTLQNEISASKDRSANIKGLVDAITEAVERQAKFYDDRLKFLEQAYQDFRAERARETRDERPIFDKRTSNVILFIGVLIVVFLGVIAWKSISG